jgi:nicotinamidase-related amidase
MGCLALDRCRTALVVIDMQRGFDEIAAAGTPRNNPGAEDEVAVLLDAFRSAGGTVVHVRHASREANSPFRPERPGFAVMPLAAERDGEPVFVKRVNSAFIGTELEPYLRRAELDTMVIVGATTNHCVETTTRMAGNLGFDAKLVRDATWTFDRAGIDGERHRAADVHRMSLANLAGEFAAIVTTAEVVTALSALATSAHRGDRIP